MRLRDGREFPPLHWAAQGGHLQGASVLLVVGADVDANHEHPGGDAGWIHRTQGDDRSKGPSFKKTEGCKNVADFLQQREAQLLGPGQPVAGTKHRRKFDAEVNAS